MNVIIVDLVWRDIAGLGEDEQGCGIELNTLLQVSCSLHPSVNSKKGSEVGVVEVAEHTCTWVAG